mgnify:CR=1 FL=1
MPREPEWYLYGHGQIGQPFHGFVSSKDSFIEITIPSFRLDIQGSSDIVEEITRIYGFEKIEPIQKRYNSQLSECLPVM